MEQYSTVQLIAAGLMPVLFAITLHEVAHGWAAKLLGDRTAEQQGRLSINPIHHIDPIGTLLVPGLLMALGGFIFGWAKPVPVNWGRLRNPRRDMVIVALAGPAANLAMALAWALLFRIGMLVDNPAITEPLKLMVKFGIGFNLVLMLLNLIPLPPLDGGRIASGLLPPRVAYKYDKIEPYGFYILLALIATGLLSSIIGLPMAILQSILFGIAGAS